MKLLKIGKSDKPDKKLMATFETEGRTKTTHFGSKGMDDYTITKDKEQRDRYRQRHKKDLDTKDPTRAGYLSWFILWGDSTKMKENIKTFKNKFNL
jgi:ABC-type sulfate transport system substrate-binding protein